MSRWLPSWFSRSPNNNPNTKNNQNPHRRSNSPAYTSEFHYHHPNNISNQFDHNSFENNNNNEIAEQQHFIASRLFRNRNRARHNSAGTNNSSNGDSTNIMQSPFLSGTGLTTTNNGTTNLVFPSSHTTHNVNNIIDNFNLNQQNREHALYQTVIGNELLDANIEYLPDRNQEIDNGMTPSALINLRSAAGTATSNILNHGNNNNNNSTSNNNNEGSEESDVDHSSVPGICPLETLHNNLTLRQIDDFLNRMISMDSLGKIENRPEGSKNKK